MTTRTDMPEPPTAGGHAIRLSTSTLVIGGQRSGKSRFAEGLVVQSGLAPVYFALNAAAATEMAERIERHRARRGAAWTTVEEPLELAAAIGAEARAGRAVLVDCLTLWLSNVLEAGRDADAEGTRLAAAVAEAAGPVAIVSNEVGSGVIPDNALARAYADALGTLNQRIAAAVPSVVFVVAGLPTILKSPLKSRPER